jgi:hypothetical protein
MSSYLWEIYLKCRVGGVFNGGDDLSQIDNFTYYLNTKSGFVVLEKKYTWIKCNTDFKGFYVSNYDVANYDKLIEVLSAKPDVRTRKNINRLLSFYK